MHERRNIFVAKGTMTDDERIRDRQILALVSLSNLINKFSQKFDFNNLIDTLLLILSGQLTTPGIFAAFRITGNQDTETTVRAIGRYQGMAAIDEFDLNDEVMDFLHDHPATIQIDEGSCSEGKYHFLDTLDKMNVRILSPIIHNDRIYGMICVGEKFSGKPYTAEDIMLFSTLINTITPLVAGSHHLWEIAKLNAWYSDILNNVKQGVLVFDRNNRLKSINKSGYAVLKSLDPGLSDIESLNQLPIEEIFPNHIYNGWLDKFLGAGLSLDYQNYKNLVARKNGKTHIFNCTLSGITDGSRRIIDFIITLEDITTMKENEQKLFELHSFAERGYMISSLSHELNNYLGMVLGGVELTLLSESRGHHDKTMNLLEKLKNNTLQMKRFVEGMTDSARLNTLKQKGDLNRIISDVAAFLSIRKEFKAAQLTTELDKNLPHFDFDPNQLSQLILNLLNNAADANLESKNRPSNIGIRSNFKGDRISLTVTDNGIGMDEETKNKIFKTRFTTKKAGHGYGLVTCSKIIENHDGRISVESELGKGTTVTIEFPINQ